MFRILKVTGESLSPAYQEGDFVLVSKIPFLLTRLKQGDVVIYQHPVYGTLIKYIDKVFPEQGLVTLIGTHEDSIDSRRFGSVPITALIGKVIWQIKKPRE